MNKLIFLAACLLPGFLFSQETTLADSLRRLLQTARPDTNRVNLLNDLAWELREENPSQAIAHLDSALALARRLKFKKGEGNALNFRGVVEGMHGRSEAAISFFEQALKIRQSLGDKIGVSSLHNNIGNEQENQGDYLAALASYEQALRLREELQDTARMARSWYNIANVYESIGNHSDALEYIFRYLEFAERTGDEEGAAKAWNIIGNIKTELDRFEEALQAYEKSLALQRKLGEEWEEASALNNIANLKDAIAERKMDAGGNNDSIFQLFNEAKVIHQQALAIRTRLQDTVGQAEIFNNMGYVLKNLGSFQKKTGKLAAANQTWQEAENYLDRSLEIRQKEGNRAGIMEIYNGIADVRRRQERFREALDYTNKYYQIAVEIGDLKYQQNGLKDLARIHFALGEHKQAYEYLEAYDKLRSRRFTEELTKQQMRREAVYGNRRVEWENERQRQTIALNEAKLKTANTLRNSLLGGAALLLLLAFVLFNRNKIIRSEKQRSEDLLLNILPAQTAEELKTHGKAIARRYDAVTVLFSDFQGFTQLAEATSPEALVAELDECFQAFDEITARLGIEKIKTIGDAYLCVAGLPLPQAAHAENTVRAALEMQRFMQEFRERKKQEGKQVFHCRIGIHSGAVVAGVVGKRKFAYDIWGDTVNLAARMEQSGEIDRVNISQTTFELLDGKFRCTYRGKIEAKNKGKVDMYFVERENLSL